MLVIGHRGAGAYAPHNSRQAFVQAIAMGADMIETDIRVTYDNIPVIYHDRDTLWGPIAALTWEELHRYPLGNGEYILSLEEVLLLFGSKIRFNLEIKQISLEKLEPVLNILKKFPLDPLVSSFSIPILEELSFLTNYQKALLINKAMDPEKILGLMEHCQVSILNLYYPLLDSHIAELVNGNDYQIIAWTDFHSEIWNPIALYKKALELNCLGFITGKPNLLTEYLKFLKLRF
ncbi:MAG: hypothetical protein VR72_10685 [Clostridiaceae bacterium BRH_c20a]|nr:MAG: hypothetical protein VR72_10685 [Clostridiaceae bacterium BRH_c20a]